MDSGRGDAEFSCCLPDAHQITGRRVCRCGAARDIPASAQVADKVLREAQAARGGALLPIKDTGDGRVVVILREASHQGNYVFVGTHRRWT